jgi:hypothetical protein
MDNDDFCFDSDFPRGGVPPAETRRAPPATRAVSAPARAANPVIVTRSPVDTKREHDVLYLTLLATAGDTVTEVTSPKTGDDVQENYTELFLNNTNNPVRVQVFARLVTPGTGIFLSTDNSNGNQGLFDALSLTANGRTESVHIIVLPTFRVYMREYDPAFPMGGQDLIRVRVFDPAKLFSYSNLYPKFEGR